MHMEFLYSHEDLMDSRMDHVVRWNILMIEEAGWRIMALTAGDFMRHSMHNNITTAAIIYIIETVHAWQQCGTVR